MHFATCKHEIQVAIHLESKIICINIKYRLKQRRRDLVFCHSFRVNDFELSNNSPRSVLQPMSREIAAHATQQAATCSRACARVNELKWAHFQDAPADRTTNCFWGCRICSRWVVLLLNKPAVDSNQKVCFVLLLECACSTLTAQEDSQLRVWWCMYSEIRMAQRTNQIAMPCKFKSKVEKMFYFTPITLKDICYFVAQSTLIPNPSVYLQLKDYLSIQFVHVIHKSKLRVKTNSFARLQCAKTNAYSSAILEKSFLLNFFCATKTQGVSIREDSPVPC